MMRRLTLTLALLFVLGGATFASADPAQGLREPAFPGAGASEGDLMTIVGQDALLSLSIYL
jgi:hypothetical protein